MDIVLVDTSVWINFFKAIETDSSLYLKNNFVNINIAICPTIVQEVLQGVVSDSQYKAINKSFGTFTKLIENSYTVAFEASKLYRDLRKKGITVRKPNDCIIAIYAIRNNIVLLNDDRDFQLIAKNSLLKVMNFN